MKELAGIGKSYRKKLAHILESNPQIITVDLVANTLSVDKQEAGRLLSRWHKSGWVSRVKRGTYIPVLLSSKSGDAKIEEPNLAADLIYWPGYIGGFTAVKHWDLSEQIIESITYYTLKKVKDRNPQHGGISFTLKTTSSYKVFGLSTIWYGSKKVRISDPTKTIIDLLDDPKVVGGVRVVADILEEYLDSEFFDFNRLVEYGLKMKNGTIFKRLGFLLELKFDIDENQIEEIRTLISPSYSDLDTMLECSESNKKWMLKIPKSWKLEYDRKK